MTRSLSSSVLSTSNRNTTLRCMAQWQRREKAHRFSGLELAPHFGVGQFGENSSCRPARLGQEQIVPIQGKQGAGRSQEKRGVAHGAGQRSEEHTSELQSL